MKRRTMFGLGAVAGLGAAGLSRNHLFQWFITRGPNKLQSMTPVPTIQSGTCLLTPEQTSGPFYFSTPARSDIREDRAGLQFDLKMQVVDVDSCMPVENAVVEIWHCDAQGRYSGYPEKLSRRSFDSLVYIMGNEEQGLVKPENDKLYLRGNQTTNDEGIVEFKTIFPGWYDLRVTHVHFKVHADNKTYLTSQLYFPDELVNEIYSSHEDYVAHGVTPYTHNNDLVLDQYPDGTGLLLEPVKTANGVMAEAKLGIQRA